MTKSIPIFLVRQGDVSEDICPKCRTLRATRYEYRTIYLSKSNIHVPDVLVSVCETCDSIATMPHQSAPKLEEALEGAPIRIDARIPNELRDVIGMMTDSFGGLPEPFAGGMLRYYMTILTEPVLARRIGKLATSPAAEGTPRGRLVFRLDRAFMTNAMRKVNANTELVDQSGLVRGITVAARDDACDKPNAKRAEAFRAIALAAA